MFFLYWGDAGSFALGNGNRNCTACSPGYFAAEDEAETCEACALGSYVDFERATECIECVRGTFMDVEGYGGSDGCKVCQPGSFAEFDSVTIVAWFSAAPLSIFLGKWLFSPNALFLWYLSCVFFVESNYIF